MRFGVAAWVVACLMAAPEAGSAVDGGMIGPGAGTDRYVAGEAIVRFEPGASVAERRAARRTADVRFEDSLGLPRAELVEIEGPVAAAVRRLERQPGVAYAQPNFRYEAVAVEAPDDKFFGELWGLDDPALPDPGVGILEAWEEGKGAGQVIAVLDTGVDLTHPDLEGSLWVNPSPDPVSEDVHGFDFVDDDGDPDDYQFHGTHVAGTAAAIAENEKGIAGVAPEAKVMAVRVLDGDGEGKTSEIAEGIDYATEHGADVINMSLSGPAGGDKAMSDAVTLAAVKEVVVIAAAGNEGSNNDATPTTPCTLPQANLICVGALNRNGSLSSFSNYGANSVDIAAPGGGDVVNGGVLSAKTDYGPEPPLFEDDFEGGLAALWETEAPTGGIEWGLASKGASGAKSATDSPAPEQDYAPEAETFLRTDGPVDLTGKRGCRVHFHTKYEIEPQASNGDFFDFFFAGAVDEEEGVDGVPFAGTSSGFSKGAFLREEASISELDGRSDVHPLFGITSDELVEMDGAYVDDIRLICRDETYLDEITPVSQYDQPDAGSYVRFQGTSMAAPHVAGVAALVRAAAPGATATQVVDAILTGSSAMPQDDPGRPTATHGIADACQAIAVATGKDFKVECPGSSENVIPVPIKPGGAGTIAPPPPPPPALRTFFRKHPPKLIRTRRSRARAVFVLGSSEEEVTFVCRVGGGLFRPCPKRFAKRFGPGWHAVRAAARATDGRADQTPAVYRFRVKRID
jgi:thermitase